MSSIVFAVDSHWVLGLLFHLLVTLTGVDALLHTNKGRWPREVTSGDPGKKGRSCCWLEGCCCCCCTAFTFVLGTAPVERPFDAFVTSQLVGAPPGGSFDIASVATPISCVWVETSLVFHLPLSVKRRVWNKIIRDISVTQNADIALMSDEHNEHWTPPYLPLRYNKYFHLNVWLSLCAFKFELGWVNENCKRWIRNLIVSCSQKFR